MDLGRIAEGNKVRLALAAVPGVDIYKGRAAYTEERGQNSQSVAYSDTGEGSSRSRGPGSEQIAEICLPTTINQSINSKRSTRKQ